MKKSTLLILVATINCLLSACAENGHGNQNLILFMSDKLSTETNMICLKEQSGKLISAVNSKKAMSRTISDRELAFINARKTDPTAISIYIPSKNWMMIVGLNTSNQVLIRDVVSHQYALVDLRGYRYNFGDCSSHRNLSAEQGILASNNSSDILDPELY